jgi:hypothetical protein
MYRKQYLANKPFALVHSTCSLVHAVGISVVIKSGETLFNFSLSSLTDITGILLLLFFLQLIASVGVILLHWFGVVFLGGDYWW